MPDFEVLVIGDACTDDTEAVVQGFNNPRLRFVNLATRCGSQNEPNNHGLTLARGAFIAYLGHDDIWWPDHLATGLQALEDSAADVSAALTILYGPPASGVLAITGMFPGDHFDPQYFFVPSSMMHRADALSVVGAWRSVEACGRATDVDLVYRLFDHGVRVVPTNTLTVFKFNAAWRRDSYIDRSVGEQEGLLARIRTGVDFRQRELANVLNAVTAGRLQPIRAAREPAPEAAQAQYQTRRFKGAMPQFDSVEAISALTGAWRFEMTGDYMGFEWHGLEVGAAGTAFRWSGPATVSCIPLPILSDATCALEIEVVSAIAPEALSGLVLSVNGRQVAYAVLDDDLGKRLVCEVVAEDKASRPMRVEFSLARTWQPKALGINADERWLGLAIGAITVCPTA